MSGPLYVPLEVILLHARTAAVIQHQEPRADDVVISKEAEAIVIPFLNYACSIAVFNNMWTKAQAKMLERELYRALYCKTLCWNDLSVSMPYRLDACWHELLLNTGEWAVVCNKLGRVLAHTTRTMGDSAEKKNARVNTLAVIYQQVYGEEPDAWCWELEQDAPKGKRKAEEKHVWSYYTVYSVAINGAKTAVRVTADMSVATLKHLLFHIKGYVPSTTRVIFDNRKLDDDASMADRNIVSESVLHTVSILKGC